MSLLKGFPLLFLSMLNFSILRAQRDTVLYQKDSVIDIEETSAAFFRRSEKTTTPDKVFLVTKAGKTMTIAAFLKTLVVMEGTGASSSLNYGFADLGNDGKKELVISGFTGGAHCCDEFYFFKNIALNKYQYFAKTFAGNVYIREDNDIIYDFDEQFGYFFTCYACAYEDSSDTEIDAIHHIGLRYKSGKLVVEDGGPETLRAIRDKLGRLSEKPYQKLESEADQDDGLRKEFALNLAVYYYSFGKRNIASTKLVFDKYYKFPDAKNVWAAFVKQLQYMRKNNDF